MKQRYGLTGTFITLAILAYSAVSCGGGQSDAATPVSTAGSTTKALSNSSSGESSSCRFNWQTVNPLGVNLGSQTHWGAEQLLNNVLPNPGLEPYVDAGLFRVDRTEGQNLLSNDTWLGRADHQWAGATATVLTGDQAGWQFSIVDNTNTDKALLVTDQAGSNRLDQLSGQIIAVRSRQLNPSAPIDLQPAKWTTQGKATLYPGAAIDGVGQTVIKMAPLTGPATLITWLDAISDRAGSLLPIDNDWVFSVQTRASGPVSLSAQIGRAGSSNTGQRNLNQTTGNLPAVWQRQVWVVKRDNPINKGTLEVRLTATGTGSLEIDNLYLGPREGMDAFTQGQNSHLAFRQEVKSALASLGAGYLRDWQGQLGDSPANRFAARAARAPHKYRRERTDLIDGYSIPEFLALAKELNATPWLVMPTTWSSAESADFARRMAKALLDAGTGNWILEFGNENWNTVFQPAGFGNLNQHIQAANGARAAFEYSWKQSATAGQAAPQWVNNLQFFNPPAQAQSLQGFNGPAALSVASYSAVRIDQGASFPQALFDSGHLARWQQWRALSAAAKRPSFVPEVNLHPLAGTLDANTKAQWLNDPVATAAVALNLLTGWSQGASTQLLYSLAGYDAGDQKGQLVPLFGLYDKLAAGAKLRPSGQAMQWLNQWLGGKPSKVALLSSDSEIQAGIWRFAKASTGDARCQPNGLVLLNLSSNAAVQSSAPLQSTGGRWSTKTVGFNLPAQQKEEPANSQINLPAWSLVLINQK